MRFFGGLAAVTLAACGAFSAADEAPPPSSPDAGPNDAGDASPSDLFDARGPTDDARADDGGQDAGVRDGSATSNRALVQTYVPTTSDLGVGPSYAVSFPTPTKIGNVPMIVIAARASTLESPGVPFSNGVNWTLDAASKDHVALAIYEGPADKSVSSVAFTFSTSPTDLVVLLLEWTFSSARFTPGYRSASGAATVDFVGAGATPTKMPYILNFAAVVTNSVSSSPSNGFVALSPPITRGSTTLLAADYSPQDMSAHAASYVLSAATGYDAITLVFNALP